MTATDERGGSHYISGPDVRATIYVEREAVILDADERDLLNEMTDHEMVAYWNILQFPGLLIGDGKTERHQAILSELLFERRIPHLEGHRTVAVEPYFKVVGI